MPSGLELARDWYVRAMAPRLDGVPHSAALIGDGSEVLGFDDLVSTDHDFGRRVQIFVGQEDVARVSGLVEPLEVPQALERPEPPSGTVPARVTTVATDRFFRDTIGFDPVDEVSAPQWLRLPTQRLAGLTGGEVFHDPGGDLARRRAVLTWYPDDVWRLALAAAWLRVGQHQAFVGRTGARGDDLGSRLIAARLVREQMRIGFLLERVWAPYDKWFGTAFARLGLASEVGASLAEALAAADWRARESALVTSASALIEATNRTGLGLPVDAAPRRFFTRDITVVDADALVTSLVGSIEGDEVRGLVDGLRRGTGDGALLPSLPGTIDQVSDNVDVLTHPARCAGVTRGANLPT